MDICTKINLITDSFGTRMYKSIETKYGYINLEITRDKYIYFLYQGILLWDKQEEPSVKQIESEISKLIKRQEKEFEESEKAITKKIKEENPKPTKEDWDNFELELKNFDWAYIYTTDHRVRKIGDNKKAEILNKFTWLKSYNKTKAQNLYNKYAK